MQEVSASRDLSEKTMTFNIDELNKLFRKNGYYLATVYRKSEALRENAKPDDLMRARIERGKSLNELVSEVLKIDVLSVVWNTDDTVKIKYLEK